MTAGLQNMRYPWKKYVGRVDRVMADDYIA